MLLDLYDSVAAPAYFFCRDPICPYKPKLPLSKIFCSKARTSARSLSRISDGVPVIGVVFVFGAAGAVVVTWRFGAVVEEVTGTDVVVAGIVVTGAVDVDVDVDVSGAVLDVVTSGSCTEVGVTASDVPLDEQAARTPRPKEATRIGARMCVFICLACLRGLLTHAQTSFLVRNSARNSRRSSDWSDRL